MKEDEWYWQDELFGKTPKSGSLMDIGQSLLNPNYDPEGTLIGRVLRDAPPPSMADRGRSMEQDPMGNPDETPPNPVDRSNEPEPTPFVPSEYTMNMPAKMSMDIAGVPRKREVGMVGGKPRMQLNANTEEEEEMARLAQYLRNIG